MFPVLQPAQVRSDDGADRSLIGGAVAESTDVFEDRANIEAGTAADAVEGVALFGIVGRGCRAGPGAGAEVGRRAKGVASVWQRQKCCAGQTASHPARCSGAPGGLTPDT